MRRLNYQIAISPDANSGSGFAEGSVKTTFAGSVMEGRASGMYWSQEGADHYNTMFGTSYIPGGEIPWDIIRTYPLGWDELYLHDEVYGWGTELTIGPSTTNTWKDSSTVTGGIKNLQKAFSYKSGFNL